MTYIIRHRPAMRYPWWVYRATPGGRLVPLDACRTHLAARRLLRRIEEGKVVGCFERSMFAVEVRARHGKG